MPDLDTSTFKMTLNPSHPPSMERLLEAVRLCVSIIEETGSSKQANGVMTISVTVTPKESENPFSQVTPRSIDPSVLKALDGQ